MIALWLAAGLIASPPVVQKAEGAGAGSRSRQQHKEPEHWRIQVGDVVYTTFPPEYDPKPHPQPVAVVEAEAPADEPPIDQTVKVSARAVDPTPIYVEAQRFAAEQQRVAAVEAKERKQALAQAEAQARKEAKRKAEQEAKRSAEQAARDRLAEQIERARLAALEEQRRAQIEAARLMELARIDEEESILALMLAA